MGAILDIFRKDAFNVVNLTAAINKLPYKPTRITDMGLFQEKGINTTMAAVEERDGKLGLLTSRARGVMTEINTIGLRKVRAFQVPHIPINESVLADQVQNLRAFGSANQMETVATAINERLQSMKDWIDTTKEYYRVSSLQGNLLDGDTTTVLFNWFSEFGLTQTSYNVDFTSFNSFTAPGALTAADGGGSGLLSAGAYTYKVTFVTSAGETQASVASNSITLAASHKMTLTAIPVGPAGTLYRNLYRTTAGGSSYLFLTQISDNTTVGYTDNIADASLGSNVAPTVTNIPSARDPYTSVMDMKKDVATKIIRAIEDALGVTMYRSIRVLCGNAFWDNFINHPTVIHSYERWLQAGDTGTGGSFFRNQQRQQLNRQGDSVAPGGFEFAGMYWENYRGHIGTNFFVPDKGAIAFPEGCPDLFIEHIAPAPFIETVNTIGLPYYAKQELMRFGLGIELHAEANPLPMCTRPGALIKLTQTAP